MPDADKNLEILIETKADLSGAKAAEAQLEQDIAKAKALGEAYDDLEGRFLPRQSGQSTGQAEVAFPGDAGEKGTTGVVTGPDTSHDQEAASRSRPGRVRAQDEAAPEEADAGGKDTFDWLKAGIEGLRSAAEAMARFLGMAGSPAPSSAETRDKPPVENQLSNGPARAEDEARQAAEKANSASPAALSETWAMPALSDNAPGKPVAEEDARTAEQAAAPARREGNEPAEPFMDGQAQAIQFSGERIRAALEQNTQITVSLFNRTLELIDQQNRKLGEVDRKIAELSGQMKSLKNL